MLTFISTLDEQGQHSSYDQLGQHSSYVLLVSNQLNRSLLNTQFRKPLSPLYSDEHQPTSPPHKKL